MLRVRYLFIKFHRIITVTTIRNVHMISKWRNDRIPVTFSETDLLWHRPTEERRDDRLHWSWRQAGPASNRRINFEWWATSLPYNIEGVKLYIKLSKLIKSPWAKLISDLITTKFTIYRAHSLIHHVQLIDSSRSTRSSQRSTRHYNSLPCDELTGTIFTGYSHCELFSDSKCFYFHSVLTLSYMCYLYITLLYVFLMLFNYALINLQLT